LNVMSSLRITRRAADRLRSGHLWIYRTDLEAAQEETPGPGALVTITDSRHIPLGTAIYSSASQIAARLISRAPGLSRAQYLLDLRTRMDSALALRRTLAPITATDNAHRLIFSEADNLPGIVADRYNDLVLVQLLTQGTAQDDVRSVLVAALSVALTADGEPTTIWERPDPHIRQLEELPPPPAGPLLSSSQEAPATTTFSHSSHTTSGGQPNRSGTVWPSPDVICNTALPIRWKPAAITMRGSMRCV